MGRPKKNNETDEDMSVKAEAAQEAASGFNLMSMGDEISAAVREGMLSMCANRKVKTNVCAMKDIDAYKVELPHLIWQYLAGNRYIKAPNQITIIGEPGFGKSSLSCYFIGEFWKKNIYGMMVSCESEKKFLEASRIKQLLSRDKKSSEMIFQALNITTAQDFDQFETVLTDTVLACRGKARKNNISVPMNYPIFVVCDSISKLKPPDSAVKDKSTSDSLASALLMGKLWAHFDNKLGAFRTENNAIVLHTVHPKTKIDMGNAPAYMNTPKSIALGNTSFVGGISLQQGSVLVFSTFKGARFRRDTKSEYIGHKCHIRCNKSNVGPCYREAEFVLQQQYEPGDETEETNPPTFLFDEGFLKICEDKGVLGIKEEGKDSGIFSSKRLGIIDARAEDLYREVFTMQEHIEEAARILSIQGYSSNVEEIKGEESEQNQGESNE